ncbi:methyl-accepting chemotaxis protein [uncultured Maricaulis sp.]|uniref:methyl-accepting chemotaxis protein n=1 Tax=uncultured Maricaulis sp. TaxID=174710 RepID=UPI0030DBA8CE|tara:strand:+ start:3053 stop:5020 length:1968 start_codon:yes stop_codon:yes gene_type:complete
MFKLSLRQKMLGAFLLLAAISITIGMFGYFGTQALGSIFTQYRGAARESLAVNAVNVDLGAARLEGFRWRASGAPERVASFETTLEGLVGALDTAGLSDAGEQAVQYRDAFRAAVEQQDLREAAVADFSEAGRNVREVLSEVIASAYRDGDGEAAYYASIVQEKLLLARLYADRFLTSNTAEDSDRVRNETEAVRQAFTDLEGRIENPQRQALLRQAEASFGTFNVGFDAAVQAISTRNSHLAAMDTIGPQIAAAAAAKRDQSVATQNTLGPQAQADVGRTEMTVLVSVGVGVVLAVVLGLFFSGQISGAITRITRDMRRLADGDNTFEINGVKASDEIGDMARALQVFRDNSIEMDRVRAENAEAEARTVESRREATRQMADMFEQSVGTVIQALADASAALQGNARELNGSVESTGARSTSVAAAAEQASAGVESIAAASEELTASILEVSSQVAASATAARSSSDHAKVSSANLDSLTEAVNGVDEIVRAITGVAEQTNLLALNATIEAARAGDAGKGFAVVASEVKALAEQTQQLTVQIESQLQKIGQSSNDAIASTREIIGRVDEIDRTTTALAGAVEEQTAATSEISAAAQQAAAGARSVSEDISGVQISVSESAAVAGTVDAAAAALRDHSDKLQSEVRQFLETVRAA